MLKRDIEKELVELAKSYPVVSITGPRQSGKTTLVRHLFSDKPYANLESPDVREKALLDPRGFLEQYPDGAILDEIQRAPDLLSYIQVIVDECDRKGMFILTGSQLVEVHQAISQSLAGRVALLKVLPLSLKELAAEGIRLTLDEAMYTGGYPRIFRDQLNPTKTYRNYFETYIERDLRQMIKIKDLTQFQMFIRLCAGRIGQVLNMESLTSDVGISAVTVKHWLSILEASFILFRLQPYYENFGKRMIKAPKLFFTDVGLATYLLGIENAKQLERDPLRGHLVENLVITELMKARLNQGLDPHLYYYRDVKKREVDAIFQSGRNLIPIEIKASKTFNKALLKNLNFFADLVQERMPKGYLVYAGEDGGCIHKTELINYSEAWKIIPQA